MPSKKKKGIVGIETAIVLIAFVIVAAALAFVALNMGLFTTQKSKEVIGRGLGEASSALMVDGSVFGNVSDNKLTLVAAPIKLSTGQQPIDLMPGKASVRLIAKGEAYENVLNHTFYIIDYKLFNESRQEVKYENGTAVTLSSLSIVEIAQTIKDLNLVDTTNSPSAVFVIIENVNGDTVLEAGEKAILLLFFKDSKGLEAYDKFTAEIRVAVGAPLLIERTVPPTLPSTGGAIMMD
jgi:flagellin FlaB